MTIPQHTAAGIDLGSNTFRLLVADCCKGKMSLLVKEMATVRLGRNLEGSGLLHEESMQNGLAVLSRFRQTLAIYRPRSLRICGTAALRRAENSQLFLTRAEELLQQQIDIISGDEEAHLSYMGVLAGLAGHAGNDTGPMLLVDVGGGSTELIYAARPANAARTSSVDLGVLPLTEKFLTGPLPDPASLDTLIRSVVQSAVAELGLLQQDKPFMVVGCGGTATSMAALALGLAQYDATLVHGYILHQDEMAELWRRLSLLSADSRNALPCLGEGRGEILPAGLRIYHVLLQHLQKKSMRVSDTGLLEGILLSGLSQAQDSLFPNFFPAI